MVGLLFNGKGVTNGNSVGGTDEEIGGTGLFGPSFATTVVRTVSVEVPRDARYGFVRLLLVPGVLNR